jgi:hypothetical protein
MFYDFLPDEGAADRRQAAGAASLGAGRRRLPARARRCSPTTTADP